MAMVQLSFSVSFIRRISHFINLTLIDVLYMIERGICVSESIIASDSVYSDMLCLIFVFFSSVTVVLFGRFVRLDLNFFFVSYILVFESLFDL